MKKELKDTIVVELGQKLKEFPHFYLVDTAGLNAEQTSNSVASASRTRSRWSL